MNCLSFTLFNIRIKACITVFAWFMVLISPLNAESIKKPLLAASISKSTLASSELFNREQVINVIVLKNYQELQKATQDLMASMLYFCSDAQAKEHSKVQQGFIKVRLAWAKAQMISFGPISFLQRRERFDFWPDKHRVGERQIRNLLNAPDQLPNNLESLQNKSVAVQGLGALERMLYAKSGFSVEKHCPLSILIVKNLAHIADEIFQQWAAEPILFKNDLLNPQAGITYFSDINTVVSMIANDMTTQLRIVSDIKLARALPKKGKASGNYKKLETWRTGLSFQLMQNNISTVQLFYELGFAESLSQIDLALHKELNQLFALSIKQLSDLDEQSQANLSTAFNQTGFVEKINQVQQSIRQIDQLIKTQLLPRYGLTLKFNALDGD